MRPLRLSIKGFTAFRDEQEIDLSALELFAIAGPTGAGKSSLLDAVTYALYGKVERVGGECAQLISQGLPSMAVWLEFGVNGDRWRVTRRTYRKAPTDALLERLGEGEWVPEASKVREVNERVLALLGLDYDGFTRAVLLPQGKFDQFLSGEAKERRRILTDLLGLEIFERMAKHANGVSRDARARVDATQRLLGSEFGAVTADALAAAEAQAAGLRARETALVAAQTRVRAIVRRRDEARHVVASLREAASEARLHAASAGTSAKSLAALGGEVSAAAEVLRRARGGAAEAVATARAAAAKHAAAVEKWGTVRQLSALQSRAEQLPGLRREIAELDGAAVAAARAVPSLKAALAAREKEATAARASEREATVALAVARAELERARHDEALAVVSRGLRKGAPCPICGKPLSAAPKAPPAAALARAEAKTAKAESGLERARDAVRDADAAVREARRAAIEAAAAVDAANVRLKKERSRVEDVEVALREALGARLPPDPAAALAERIDGLEGLERAAQDAERSAQRRQREEADALAAQERLSARLERERGALPLAAAERLVARATKAAPEARFPSFAARPPSGGDPGAWAGFATTLGAALGGLAAALEDAARARDAAEEPLRAEALAAVGELLPAAPSLDELATELDGALRATSGEAAAAASRAGELAARLERKASLEGEIAELARRGELYHALALDLQANAIVDFLQGEALRALAEDGTRRLEQLSDGRYRLRYRDEEFWVVDTWNGDEERSVRTLSGGETFLASLALALSLSEQVRVLAATERARLDSLFLDEGFGTLDPETLATVVDGIQRLGVDGRLVGVISHVRELTDQFPRIEVEKSTRGSKATLVAR